MAKQTEHPIHGVIDYFEQAPVHEARLALELAGRAFARRTSGTVAEITAGAPVVGDAGAAAGAAVVVPASQARRGPGRPPGSKNRPSTVIDTETGEPRQRMKPGPKPKGQGQGQGAMDPTPAEVASVASVASVSTAVPAEETAEEPAEAMVGAV